MYNPPFCAGITFPVPRRPCWIVLEPLRGRRIIIVASTKKAFQNDIVFHSTLALVELDQLPMLLQAFAKAALRLRSKAYSSVPYFFTRDLSPRKLIVLPDLHYRVVRFLPSQVFLQTSHGGFSLSLCLKPHLSHEMATAQGLRPRTGITLAVIGCGMLIFMEEMEIATTDLL